MPAYSPLSYTLVEAADSSDKNHSFAWPYLDTAHIYVQLQGADLTQIGDGTGFVVDGGGTSITIGASVTVNAGDEIRIYRVTPSAALVDFSNSSVLTESDLDTATLQALYQAHEAYDAAYDVLPTAGASGSVLVKATAADRDVQWDSSLDAGTAQVISQNTVEVWGGGRTIKWNTVPRLNQDDVIDVITDSPQADDGNAIEVQKAGDYKFFVEATGEHNNGNDGEVSLIFYYKPKNGAWTTTATVLTTKQSISGVNAFLVTQTLTFEGLVSGDRVAVYLQPTTAGTRYEWLSATTCSITVEKVG